MSEQTKKLTAILNAKAKFLKDHDGQPPTKMRIGETWARLAAGAEAARTGGDPEEILAGMTTPGRWLGMVVTYDPSADADLMEFSL